MRPHPDTKEGMLEVETAMTAWQRPWRWTWQFLCDSDWCEGRPDGVRGRRPCAPPGWVRRRRLNRRGMWSSSVSTSRDTQAPDGAAA
mmetsp:Transcript_48147/g.140311  ORF Transcript_48147/g.140311 Transcript_48147/m.140311 type:complete len:87 (-) Transcript_48147:45-305(-)